MLRRLRGSRAESPSPPTAAAELSNENDAVKVAATKSLTMDEKAAMLTEKVVEIVPGMTMPFSRQELVRIKKRFLTLQRDGAVSQISIATCVAMPELAGSSRFTKLLLQLVASMDAGISTPVLGLNTPTQESAAPDRIAFDAFFTALSVLSNKQSIAVKRQVLFRIYDVDRDGRVAIDDFVTTILAITPALTRTELEDTITSQFPLWVSPAGDTTLSMDAFQALFTDADIHAALTIAF